MVSTSPVKLCTGQKTGEREVERIERERDEKSNGRSKEKDERSAKLSEQSSGKRRVRKSERKRKGCNGDKFHDCDD